MSKIENPPTPAPASTPAPVSATEAEPAKDSEKGGPKGPDPVRYGDWERKGIAVDF